MDPAVSSSSSKCVKRKLISRDEPMDTEPELPFRPWLGLSSSSSNNKATSATISSPKETNQEPLKDLEFDFSLDLRGKNTPLKKKVKLSRSSSNNKLSLDLQIQNQVDLELTLSSTPTSSLTSLSEITKQQHRNSSTKKCQYAKCENLARGASGRCYEHGGSRRCQKPNCHEGAKYRTPFCKAHGGGERCESLGCNETAEERTNYCIAHAHGALMQDERVHGGAALGPPVCDTGSGSPEMVTEGRVHGGSLFECFSRR